MKKMLAALLALATGGCSILFLDGPPAPRGAATERTGHL